MEDDTIDDNVQAHLDVYDKLLNGMSHPLSCTETKKISKKVKKLLIFSTLN